MCSSQQKKRLATEQKHLEKLSKDREELLERNKKIKEEELKRVQLERQHNEKVLLEKMESIRAQYRMELSNYLLTKTCPKIMYSPAVMLPYHRNLLKKSSSRESSNNNNSPSSLSSYSSYSRSSYLSENKSQSPIRRVKNTPLTTRTRKHSFSRSASSSSSYSSQEKASSLTSRNHSKHTSSPKNRQSVDMQFEEEERLLSMVPEVICDSRHEDSINNINDPVNGPDKETKTP